MSRSLVFQRIIIRVIGLCALLLASTGITYGTHFRYGHIIWKARPDIAPSTAEITMYASFRRDGYGAPVIGSIIDEDIGGTSLSLGDGTIIEEPVTDRLKFKVLAFDPTDNWIYTVALNPADHDKPIIHTYSSQGPWVAQINACCRITALVNGPEAYYRVATTIDFSKDVSSPVSTLPTIVHCFAGPLCQFQVPAGDADGDQLFWRVATMQESGIVPPPGFAISSLNGSYVQWSTNGLTAGLYSAQVVIEARDNNGGIKSQVAVDFILDLGTSPPPGRDPDFLNPALVCGLTMDVVVGKPLTFQIAARDPDGGSVTLNAIGLPSGATMTPDLPFSGGGIITSSFKWIPTSVQIAMSVVIFTATDTTGRQTQCSVVLQVRQDRDGDGLPDAWEENGYTYNGVFVDLRALGADPDHKDVFLEIDYMTGLKPMDAAIDKIKAAFAAVPNSLFATPNPDGKDGITLHIDVNEELPFQATTGARPNSGVYDWSDFDTLKNAHFKSELRLSSHYAISLNNVPPNPYGGRNSGEARGIPTDDFLVAFGGFRDHGTFAEQAGAFMHELGHTLGLHHGGPVNVASTADYQFLINYKPNYLSVMNYSFNRGLLKGPNIEFDYSRFALPTLDESNLDETKGLGSPLADGYGTYWSCGGDPLIANIANDPIDWNCDHKITNSVKADLNRDGINKLISYADWSNLNFTGGAIGAGAPLEIPPTITIAEEPRFQDGLPAPSGLGSFVTSVSPSAAVRNNFRDFAGMHFVVGANPLLISALGRLCLAGNSQTHTVKLVNANTGGDVSGSSVNVNMAGCTPGQFVNANLSTPLALTPLAHYYLVSKESFGGDRWLDIGPVASRPGASVAGAVYFNGVQWITSGAPGTSYVTGNMIYEITEPPPSAGFVLSYNRDRRTLRNNFDGFVGMLLRVGAANLSVTAIGRACATGNSQTHTVKFVNASTGVDVPGGTALVNMASCVPGEFVYFQLGGPFTMQANTTYLLVSQETTGGDKWYDQSELTTMPDAAVVSSTYSRGGGYIANEAHHSYVPPNFLYTK